MKKSLIALAVLAASGAALAQSSVTIYGVADIWVGKVKGQSLAAADGGIGQSRLGFKGSEDLGGGLKANFNFEEGLNLGNGATDSTTFQRQANLGLSGGFGAIKLGRSTTALDDVFGAANSGFDSALSANAVWQNGHAGRLDAQLYYASPEFAGFSGAINTQLKGNADPKTTSFHAKYANGPIAAAVGYEDGVAQKGTLINGSYDLGMAKLMASYYTTKPDVGNRVNSYQIGADVPLSSAMTLSVGYANSKAKGGQADSAFGAAVGYSLSKRTTVYGGFRSEDRKSGAAETDVVAVGVNHTF